MREISLHILDLARNSLEAAATRVEIEIREDPAADRLQITVRDNGRGMAPEVAEQATEAAYTTRNTRRFGLGLPLMQAACERCEGGLEVRSGLGEGTEVRADLRLSHLDRAPLGDMGAVLQALCLEADRTAFVYRHWVGEQEFALDSEELRAELGGAALGHPSVACWVAEYVNEQVRALGSQA